MKTILAAAALALTSGAALADAVTLTAPDASATLHEDKIDMNVYWTERAEGYELVATYLTGLTNEAPARLVMLLEDGDNVTFGLPGAPGYHFSFIRAGDAVSVVTHGYGEKLAMN